MEKEEWLTAPLFHVSFIFETFRSRYRAGNKKLGSKGAPGVLIFTPTVENYFPVKAGFRFSRKALAASPWSSVSESSAS